MLIDLHVVFAAACWARQGPAKGASGGEAHRKGGAAEAAEVADARRRSPAQRAKHCCVYGEGRIVAGGVGCRARGAAAAA